MLRFKLFMQLLLLSIAGAALAQDTLRGIVAEENEKGKMLPLTGVNVFWLGTTIGTATDTAGVFTIECKHETHPLVISYIGYKADTLQVERHDFLTIILKNTK